MEEAEAAGEQVEEAEDRVEENWNDDMLHLFSVKFLETLHSTLSIIKISLSRVCI